MSRSGAASGIAAVALNAAGVAALVKTPSTYKPDVIDAWAAEAFAHPTETTIGGLCFALGVIALACFALELGKSPLARLSGRLITMGALINAIGSLLPVAVVRTSSTDAAPALLTVALLCDATFNACLGLGLVLIGTQLFREGHRALGGLGLVAGLLTLPVALQFMSRPAANFLAIAGPAWLLFVLAASIRMWRSKSMPLVESPT